MTATMTLKGGLTVVVDGTVDELRKLLLFDVVSITVPPLTLPPPAPVKLQELLR